MTEKIFESKLRSVFSASVVAICLYVFCVNILNVFYFAYEIQPSPFLEVLSALAFWSILCWWLMEDSKNSASNGFWTSGFSLFRVGYNHSVLSV